MLPKVKKSWSKRGTYSHGHC